MKNKSKNQDMGKEFLEKSLDKAYRKGFEDGKYHTIEVIKKILAGLETMPSFKDE